MALLSLKTQLWSQDWKRSVFIPIPKRGNAKECSNDCIISLSSHASKVMLKILQAMLHQYVNWELPNVQAEIRKGRETRRQITNICEIIQKAREFKKKIYFCFIDYIKALTLWITTNCGKFLRRWEYQTTLPVLRNLHAGQEAIVRTRQGTMNWFKIGKGVHQGYAVSLC